MAKPVVAKAESIVRARISIVWVVPIIAALVAGYLIYGRIRAAGPTITITFLDGGGLDANQTVLRYRGVKVGSVKSVTLGKDARSVVVRARLDRSAARLACEGSLFWIVKPEVNAAGLHGLETLVSGAFIQVEPGEGKEQRMFVGKDDTPVLNAPEGSLDVTLSTPHIGTLTAGAPVYYRGLEVGSVESQSLNADATSVRIRLQIQPRFASLVRQNSVFWNAGGLNISLRLFGVNVSAESVRSLIVGGIAFATPPTPGPSATMNTVFVLHEKPEDKWLEWAPAMPGWAGTNSPSVDALPLNVIPGVGSIGSNGVP